MTAKCYVICLPWHGLRREQVRLGEWKSTSWCRRDQWTVHGCRTGVLRLPGWWSTLAAVRPLYAGRESEAAAATQESLVDLRIFAAGELCQPSIQAVKILAVAETAYMATAAEAQVAAADAPPAEHAPDRWQGSAGEDKVRGSSGAVGVPRSSDGGDGGVAGVPTAAMGTTKAGHGVGAVKW